ncbi:MAG: glycosyltransferase family 39 protein, partial [Deltaproteobacteria bacterium]|nr:glycosyltransferase family 39 protein [Deltaproteobacteria bacterium]
MRAGARLALLVLVVAVVLLHLFVNRRWGYHSDELYFIECGRHLAFGYVDHAPMVPWLAGLVCPSGECSLFALRFPSLVARALAVLLTGKLVWELGGGRFATVLAGLAVIIAPALQRMGKILCIPVLEPVLWTACAIVVVYLIQGRSRRWWLALGVLAGIGLLTKHTMLIWGFAALVGIMLTPLRRDLRTPWPWLAGLIAVLIFLPHLIWQAQNDWATLEFLRNISDGMLANIPRPLFVLGQLLYMHPMAIPLWVAGLVFFFGAAGARYRVLGWIFVVSFLVMLWTHAKPYYLAPAYPALFAGGAVLLEAKLRSVALRTTAAAALIVGGLLLTPFTLPILPLPQQDDALRAVLGAIVPPEALTHDLH